ncbi:MAG: glycosyltransferase [Thermoleophilia bacterium]|nr:glycosyltransferase [Thermoleophilia bacterium]MCZ4496057.1 glycosyltransferase [Thermoleophilia bacterium]
MQASGRLPSYVVVSPVKDEAAHLPRMAESILAQTHRPIHWVIVDDGSSDGTDRIARQYAANHEWITVVHRESSERRARGAPVVHAFNAGLEAATRDGEIVVKLDGDLFIPSHYFEWLASAFRDEPRTGIAGGVVITDYGHRWELDSINLNTVTGAAKAYRRACLTDIGGLQPSMGWDGIDEYAARARGWEVRTLTELQLLHYRPRGARQAWRHARWEEGHANHFMGYRPTFMAVRVIYRMLVERPPIIGGLVIGASFAWYRLSRAPQVPDVEARRQLRHEQGMRLRAMLLGRRQQAQWRTSDGPAHRIQVPDTTPPT